MSTAILIYSQHFASVYRMSFCDTEKAYVSFASVDEGHIIFYRNITKIFTEGNRNCKYITVASIKYKFRKRAKRLRVGGRNDSRNGGRNDSGAKRLRANGKVGETTRYRLTRAFCCFSVYLNVDK